MVKKYFLFIFVISFVLSFLTLPLACNKTDTTTKKEIDSESNNVGQFEVIGIHKLTLKDGSQVESFETFVKNEFLPAVNVFPGERITIAKGDRGKDKGNYMLLFVFDTLNRRNDYIPEPGKMSEKGQKLWDSSGAEVVWDKLMEYVTQDFLADYVTVQ